MSEEKTEADKINDAVDVILGVAKKAFPDGPLSPERLEAACTLYATAVQAKKEARASEGLAKLKELVDKDAERRKKDAAIFEAVPLGSMPRT